MRWATIGTMCRAVQALALLTLSTAASANWAYRTTVDKMTGKETVVATLRSGNSLDLEFPYKGANYGTLMIRQHPTYGLDVIVGVQQGQVLCRSYDSGCRVAIKFDNAQPIVFGGAGPADHSSDSVFLRDPRRFIGLAQKATRILVQLDFFRNGTQVLEFASAAPLQWKTAAAPVPAAPPVPKAPPPKGAAPEMRSSGKSAAECRAETSAVPQERQQQAMTNCLLEQAPSTDCQRATLSTEGPCGQIYAQCHVSAKDLNSSPRAQFMSTCLKSGIAAAQAEFEARQAQTGTQWPAPPASLSGNN